VRTQSQSGNASGGGHDGTQAVMHARRLLATLEDDDLCCLLSYSALREHCRNGRQRQQANAVAATCSAELVLRMYAAMDNSPVGQPVEKLLRLLNDRALQGQVTGVLALLEQQHQQQHGQQRPPPVLLARACQALHTELGKREERRAASWVVSLRRAQACTDDMHPPMSVSTAAVMIQAATRGWLSRGGSGARRLRCGWELWAATERADVVLCLLSRTYAWPRSLSLQFGMDPLEASSTQLELRAALGMGVPIQPVVSVCQWRARSRPGSATCFDLGWPGWHRCACARGAIARRQAHPNYRSMCKRSCRRRRPCPWEGTQQPLPPPAARELARKSRLCRPESRAWQLCWTCSSHSHQRAPRRFQRA
jgi:hypothetical protein